MLLNKIKSGLTYLGYLLTRRKKIFLNLKPISILWAITWDCQKKCEYCDREKAMSDAMLPGEETVRKIISDIGKIGALSVSLTGGEVLLYKNLLMVLKLLKKEKVLVNINTNGLLLPDVWDQYRKLVYSYTIGINALTEAEIIKLSTFLERIISLRNRPRINLRFVMTPENYSDFLDSYDDYKKLSDHILYQPVHSKMSEKDYHGENDNFLSLDDINEIDMLMKKKNIKCGTLKKYISNNLYNKSVKCYAGIFTLTIDPYGNVYNCNHLKEKLGEISVNKSFFEIYNDLKYYREKIYLRDGSECQCFTNDRRLDWIISDMIVDFLIVGTAKQNIF